MLMFMHGARACRGVSGPSASAMTHMSGRYEELQRESAAATAEPAPEAGVPDATASLMAVAKAEADAAGGHLYFGQPTFWVTQVRTRYSWRP